MIKTVQTFKKVVMQVHTARAALPMVVLALLSVACGDGDREPGPEADVASQAAIDPLSSDVIEVLKERFPRLGTESLPEPKPSPDASPGDVPDNVAAAAPQKVLATATGEASFYADKFEGRRTASGIPFRQNQMVAAHRAYPFGTILRITNTRNDRSVNVRVVDRGPFGKKSRILDLSRRAAQELDYIGAGQTQVRVEVLEWGDGITA